MMGALEVRLGHMNPHHIIWLLGVIFKAIFNLCKCAHSIVIYYYLLIVSGACLSHHCTSDIALRGEGSLTGAGNDAGVKNRSSRTPQGPRKRPGPKEDVLLVWV